MNMRQLFFKYKFIISNHIHSWFGKGKLKYWDFIRSRILKHYSVCTEKHKNYDTHKVILMVDGFPGGQGGLTDRLRGALSLYSLCKEKKVVF